MVITVKLFNKDFIDRLKFGFLFGLVLIIPGMSGATLALNMDYYGKLLENISNITKTPKKSISYLLPILIGILSGFILGFTVLRILLNKLPLETIYLFAGFILGGLKSFYKKNLGSLTTSRVLLYIIGIIIPLVLLIFSFLSLEQNILKLSLRDRLIFFMLGILIALIELLPGLSATSFLIGIGYFTPLAEGISIDNLENKTYIFIYLIIIIGSILGVLIFSKIINYLMKKYDNTMYFLMAGLSTSSAISMVYNVEIKKVIDEIPSDLLGSKLLIAFVFSFVGFVFSYSLNQDRSLK